MENTTPARSFITNAVRLATYLTAATIAYNEYSTRRGYNVNDARAGQEHKTYWMAQWIAEKAHLDEAAGSYA